MLCSTIHVSDTDEGDNKTIVLTVGQWADD